MDSLAGEPGRPVILIMSVGGLTGDGNLPGSQVTRAHLERRVREDGFLIYGVRLQGRWGNDPHLGFFARESGGGFFELPADTNLTQRSSESSRSCGSSTSSDSSPR